MNAKELRVGNLIRPVFNGTNSAQTPFVVTGMFIQQCHSLELREGGPDMGHEGIPLTEIWFLRSGFIPYYRDEKRINFRHPKSMLTLEYVDGVCWMVFAGETLSDGIKYVNQLQNLFYALTGQELTLND
jgi:hypothetical protein